MKAINQKSSPEIRNEERFRPGISHRYFTIVELYVTIVILAIFSILFWPSSTALRQRAKQSACVDNMRVLYRSWVAYAENNNDCPVPLSVKLNNTGKSWKDCAYWPSIMGASLPGYKNDGVKTYSAMALVTHIGILHCPAETRSKEMSSYSVNYGMNYQIFQGKKRDGIRVKEITKLAQTALFVDSASYVAGPAWGYAHIRFRHLDGVNIIFTDGHVEWFSKEQLPDKNIFPWVLK